jgi:uncharacterized lipoprotein YmbA
MYLTARSITLFAFVMLLVAACGSSPPVRYFALSPMDSVQQQDPDNAVTLGVGPLRLPEYLNRSQIVTRGGGSELEVDEFSRWAEPLTLALHRVVSTDVDNMMNGVVVISFPWEAVVHNEVDYRLLGEVTRFDADRSGRVVLDIQWGISATTGQVAVVIRRSKYETRAARPDDPGIVVSAMNDALAMFSRDVVRELEVILQD